MAAKPKAKTRKRRRRGALQVYDVLREEILWVRIAPGSALDERDLAARFEVSRTPIREALLLLAGERLVQFLPNRTSIVAPFSLDNVGDYLDTALIIARAVARSAALSGRADAAALNERVQRFVQAVEADEWEDSLRSELEVLRHLAGLSGNIFLIKFFDEVIDAGMRMWVLHYVPNASTGRAPRLGPPAGDADGGGARRRCRGERPRYRAHDPGQCRDRRPARSSPGSAERWGWSASARGCARHDAPREAA